MGYQCLHCSRTFSTPFGLKRHISDRHQYIADEGESSQSNLLPYEEPGLWDEDFIMNYAEVISQSIIIIAKINLTKINL